MDQIALRDRCFKASLLGFQFSTRPLLEFKEDRYGFRQGAGDVLHPLEYFLLIEDGPLTGDWLADLQRILGVSPAWVSGFIAGFGGEERPSECDTDFLDGFQCGVAVLDDLEWAHRQT